MFCFWFEAFCWLNLGKSGSRERGVGGRQQCLTGLTLHPLFPLALLFVLLLEFGYQARVHVPGLRYGTLLVLLYTGGTKPDREAVEELPWSKPEGPGRVGKVQRPLLDSYSPGGFSSLQESSRPLGPEISTFTLSRLYHLSEIRLAILGSSIHSHLV